VHARRSRRGEQVIGALGPQPAGLVQGPVELAGEAAAGQRRRLVDDRLWPGVEHGCAHGGRVDEIERHHLGPEGQQLPAFLW
jgi:hypothetical protein